MTLKRQLAPFERIRPDRHCSRAQLIGVRTRLSLECLEPRIALAFTNPFELSSLLSSDGGDGSAGFVINGDDGVDYAGSAVSTAGDINGDGFDDIVVVARKADPNLLHDAGAVYLIFGNQDGFTGNISPTSLDGKNGF